MVICKNIVGLSQTINAQSRNTFKAGSFPGNNENNFQNILKKLLPEMQNNSPSLTSAPKLNKEQLMLFTQALQIQMNSRLYNTVFNNALESNALASKIMQDYERKVAHSISDMSKNDPEPPKVNFSQKNEKITEIVNQASKKYNVDVNLIYSVIKAESDFNPSTTSPRGAIGLMQLMPETARELGVKNVYDAQENVMGGTRYLKMLLERYDGQVDLALAAYNWGMGNVEKNSDRLPAETLGYIEKVKSYYKKIKV